MFCPKCKAEYKPGVTICADCGERLVEELPSEDEPVEPEEPQDEGEFTELYATSNMNEATIIESILDQEGIRHYTQGEHVTRVAPFLGPVRFMVHRDDFADARVILDEFLKSLPEDYEKGTEEAE